MSVVDTTITGSVHDQGETAPPASELHDENAQTPLQQQPQPLPESVAPLLHSLPASALFDMLVELGRTVPGAAALIRMRAAVCVSVGNRVVLFSSPTPPPPLFPFPPWQCPLRIFVCPAPFVKFNPQALIFRSLYPSCHFMFSFVFSLSTHPTPTNTRARTHRRKQTRRSSKPAMSCRTARVST